MTKYRVSMELGRGCQPMRTLNSGQLAVLRDLPEVCGVAESGEVLQGVACAPGHYLVQFWPLLTQSAAHKMWQLGASLLFDIDTEAPADDESDGFSSSTNHFARPVLFANFGNGYLHRFLFMSGAFSGGLREGEAVRDGSLCRGTASFPNDPFACILTLRMWVVQTVDNCYNGKHSKDSGESVAMWWMRNGEEHRRVHPQGLCTVVPYAQGMVAKQVRVRKEWMKSMEEKGYARGTPQEELVVASV